MRYAVNLMQWPQGTSARRDSHGWMRHSSHSSAWSSDCAAACAVLEVQLLQHHRLSHRLNLTDCRLHIARCYGRRAADTVTYCVEELDACVGTIVVPGNASFAMYTFFFDRRMLRRRFVLATSASESVVARCRCPRNV